MSRAPHRLRERGVALLIVVSLLAVVGIVGVAFAYSMHLETQATRQFVETIQVRYIAEGGVSLARALLDEDRAGSRVDTLTESWSTTPAGQDVDVDGDGTAESRWWTMEEASGETRGRYAVLIQDEGGKANLNAGEANPSPLGLGTMNLTTLMQQAGLADPEDVAEAIEAYRYGPDARPGVALVDDDGDGTVDEPDEYQSLALRGDDRRLENLGDLAAVAGLDAESIAKLSRLATVYSWDLNVSVAGTLRLNVNTATASELFEVLLQGGVEDPWQAAVNMADYVDADVELSRITRSSTSVAITGSGPLGDWAWVATPGHYETDEADGESLVWAASSPTGTYRVLALGVSGLKVGDITMNGQLYPSIDPGQFLGTFELTGTLLVSVAHRESPGTTCAFRGFELVPEASIGGTVLRGIEAVRFNELMVDPALRVEVGDANFSALGSDWACPLGVTACSNSGVGQARWTWTSSVMSPGRYYVRVYGSSTGQTVGDVAVSGDDALLVHGQVHPAMITVSGSGEFSLTIGKSIEGGTYYMEGVELSRQPDAEYIELLNLSDMDFDVSGWSIEGEATGGRPGRLPAGSLIASHGLLIAAVDLDDTQGDLGGNLLDARNAWEMSAEVNAVQLEFPSGEPSPDDDWLKVTLPPGISARLVLRSAEGFVVDEVEYLIPLTATTAFQSLEKGDPTVTVDLDADGLDESWYPSLQLYTPGLTNDNDGLKENVGGHIVVHDPSSEVVVLNRPLEGVGELAGLSSGSAWQPFASTDLANVVDRLTVQGVRLEPEGQLTAGGEFWHETAHGYQYSGMEVPAPAGQWQWGNIQDGQYRLSVYGEMQEQLTVRWEDAEGGLTAWSPPLSTDAQGRIVVGLITIGMGSTTSHTLTLEVACASISGVCHVNHVWLDPQLIRVGPVNINTAPREVLLAMPGVSAPMADRIIEARPYGDQESKGRGIGDLLLGEVLGATEEDRLDAFRDLAHLVTTQSDVFHILSLGQELRNGQVGATQRIEVVVQRR